MTRMIESGLSKESDRWDTKGMSEESDEIKKIRKMQNEVCVLRLVLQKEATELDITCECEFFSISLTFKRIY